MPKKNYKKMYSEADLANSLNYGQLEKSLHYFADLGLKDPIRLLRIYIRNGQLVGRIKNVSATGTPFANRYEIFLPDIPRFKRDIYKQP